MKIAWSLFLAGWNTTSRDMLIMKYASRVLYAQGAGFRILIYNFL